MCHTFNTARRFTLGLIFSILMAGAANASILHTLNYQHVYNFGPVNGTIDGNPALVTCIDFANQTPVPGGPISGTVVSLMSMVANNTLTEAQARSIAFFSAAMQHGSLVYGGPGGVSDSNPLAFFPTVDTDGIVAFQSALWKITNSSTPNQTTTMNIPGPGFGITITTSDAMASAALSAFGSMTAAQYLAINPYYSSMSVFIPNDKSNQRFIFENPTNTPEPSTAAGLLIGAGLIALGRKRRG